MIASAIRSSRGCNVSCHRKSTASLALANVASFMPSTSTIGTPKAAGIS